MVELREPGGARRRSPSDGRHVLLIHQLFVPGGGAGGTRHIELCRHLVRRGHRVTVVTSPVSYLTGARHESIPGEDGLSVRTAWTYESGRPTIAGRILSFLSFTSSSALAGLLAVPDVDVVWGTSPPLPQAVSALAVARARRVPFVLEVRDLWPDFAIELGVLRNPVLVALARRAERLAYRSAERIVVNSPGFVAHLEAKGVEPERITVVANGVEAGDFDPDATGEAFVRELGLDPSRHLLVTYTGAHGVPNDLDVLLDAAVRLRDLPEARVVLVGGGRDRERVVSRAAALGLDNVIFAAPAPKERIPEILAASAVCVALLKPIPLFDTTYPNKVFDYMAAGRPTVLAIDGVIRRVVEEAEGGTCVPPGDAAALAAALRRYLGDPELRRRHGRNARAFVAARFRREDQAEALHRVVVEAGRG